jgi:hypothetical protein
MLLKAVSHRYFLLVENVLKMFMQNHKHLFAIKYTNLFMRKKKIDKKIEPKEPKSRAKYQCPEKLNLFIYNANRLPANTDLLNPREVFDSNKKIYLAKDGKAWISDDGYLQTLKKTVEDCLAGLPNDFCDYIEERSVRRAARHQDKEDYQSYLYDGTLQEYGEFSQLREDLRNYADYFTNWRKHHFISFGIGGAYGRDGTPVTLPMPQSIYQLEDTKEGMITTIVPIGLSKALNGVIGDRVRTCEICNLFFWAKYKNSDTCSTPCLNALRQRRHRKTNKEAINEKRRATYQSKKEQKAAKERSK